MSYNYKAIDIKSGKEKTGSINADSLVGARSKLKSLGLIPTTINADKHNKNTSNELSGDNKSNSVNSTNKSGSNNKFSKAKAVSRGFSKSVMSNLELSLFTRQIAILLNSGMSIEKTLIAIADQFDNPKQKSLILDIKNEVASGKSFSQSLSMHSKIFDPVYCSLVNAGEQSGNLGNVMGKIADYRDRSRNLSNKIMMAMMYPLAVSVIAIVVVSVLLVYVVPQVVEAFQSSNQQLPLITKVMISMSDMLRAYGLYILLALLLFGFIVKHILKDPLQRLKLDEKILKLPVFGSLIMNLNVARFANTLSLLLSSGVPIIFALSASRDTVSNLLIKTAINAAIELVKKGASLSNSLKEQKIFPPVVIYLIASGESGGNLDELLSHVASHQELELNHRSQLMISILEPAMVVFMGGIVFLIVMAIMLPIVNMNTTI